MVWGWEGRVKTVVHHPWCMVVVVMRYMPVWEHTYCHVVFSFFAFVGSSHECCIPILTTSQWHFFGQNHISMCLKLLSYLKNLRGKIWAKWSSHWSKSPVLIIARMCRQHRVYSTTITVWSKPISMTILRGFLTKGLMLLLLKTMCISPLYQWKQVQAL